MSNNYDITTPEVANSGGINSSVVILNEFRERSKDGGDVANISTTAATNGAAQRRKICLIAKLQCLFFTMKIFGLLYEEYNIITEATLYVVDGFVLSRNVCISFLCCWFSGLT